MANARLKQKKIPDLLVELRSSMRKQGDPVRAPQQQAYMKSEMPYHGLTSAETRAICREAFADYDFDAKNASGWQADVLGIWHAA